MTSTPSVDRLRVVKIVVVSLVAVIALAAVLLRVVRDEDVPTSGAGAPAAATEVPAAPAEMGPEGSWVDTDIDASGTVTVQEWIRSATPVQRLDMITLDPDSLPGTVEARGVVVSAMDGSRLAARGAVGTKVQGVRLRTPATELYVTYTIVGETLSDETSTVAGRALVRVTSMTISHDAETGPSVRLLRGPGSVLNAACLAADAGYEVAPRGCGVPADDGAWEVLLPGANRHDRVLAQLDDA